MTQDPSLPTLPELQDQIKRSDDERIDLEKEAYKARIPSDLHFHFDMGAEATNGMVEETAHRYCRQYFVEVDYRLTIKTNAQMNDGQIIGYKVSVEARKWIDYGEW